MAVIIEIPLIFPCQNCLRPLRLCCLDSTFLVWNFWQTDIHGPFCMPSGFSLLFCLSMAMLKFNYHHSIIGKHISSNLSGRNMKSPCLISVNLSLYTCFPTLETAILFKLFVSTIVCSGFPASLCFVDFFHTCSKCPLVVSSLLGIYLFTNYTIRPGNDWK